MGMLYLAFEIWPYLIGALAIGLATGWLAGCSPKRDRRPGETTP